MASKPEPLTITIAEAQQPVFALLYVAQEKGFFRDEALHVTFRRFTSGRDALEDVVAGNADLATVYETPVVLRAVSGLDVKVLSTLHQSTNNTGLLARRDSGITQAKDLKGKRIGVPFNTNAQFFLSLYLQSQGLTTKEAILVDTSPQDLPEKFLQGQLDAVAIWNPYLNSIKSKFKSDELIHFQSDVYTEMSVLAALTPTTIHKAEALKRLYKALVRSEIYLQDYPKEALSIVVNNFNPNQQQGIRKVWPSINHTLALDHMLLNVLRGEALWLYHQGVVDTLKLDFEKIFQPKFLSWIKPYGVTVNDL